MEDYINSKQSVLLIIPDNKLKSTDKIEYDPMTGVFRFDHQAYCWEDPDNYTDPKDAYIKHVLYFNNKEVCVKYLTQHYIQEVYIKYLMQHYSNESSEKNISIGFFLNGINLGDYEVCINKDEEIINHRKEFSEKIGDLLDFVSCSRTENIRDIIQVIFINNS